MTKNVINIFNKSVLAGLCIGLAGLGYLILGGLAGQILFACGLILVVANGFKLFTGTAGFTKTWNDFWCLFLILIGNILGCALLMYIASFSSIYETIQQNAINIVNNRLAIGWLSAGILAIGCGFLMTEAVEHSREKNFWIPLLFCVPMFIICGFPHCIADAFYWIVSFSNSQFNSSVNYTQFTSIYIACVIGNYIGCNLKRCLIFNS